MKKPHNAEPSLRLGALMVREGILTHFELNSILDELKNSEDDQLLGELLISKSIITEEKLEILLIKQDAYRNGGVEHSHVCRVMKLASKIQDSIDSSADEFLSTCVDPHLK